MTKCNRPTYSTEFRFEVAQQEVDAGRSIRDVSDSLGLSKSTIDQWGRQLRNERGGNLTSAAPLIPNLIKIRELERKLRMSEADNLILRKASSLLMFDPIKGSR